MESSVKQKARLILAGIASLPIMATAATQLDQIQPNVYCSPYSACDEVPSDLSVTSGLTNRELALAKSLVQQLNQLNVITVKEMVLTNAPLIPSHYNLPDQADVAAARLKNLERLAKLRNIIEAAK